MCDTCEYCVLHVGEHCSVCVCVHLCIGMDLLVNQEVMLTFALSTHLTPLLLSTALQELRILYLEKWTANLLFIRIIRVVTVLHCCTHPWVI